MYDPQLSDVRFEWQFSRLAATYEFALGAQHGTDSRSDSAIIVKEIEARRGNIHSGTLRIFGEWFGRPMDNFHTIVSAHSAGESVLVHFDLGEDLQIWEPKGINISDAVFRIDKATRVLWRWFSYGKAQQLENLHTRNYQWHESGVLKTEDRGAPARLDAHHTRDPAVELV